MSAATDMFTDTVYVRLLDEGTDVWRPVSARELGNGVYELSAEPAPEFEHWEFGPGRVVASEKRNLSSGTTIVAVAEVKAKRTDRR